MNEPSDMDRHTILTVQRAVKRKSRKTRFPAFQDGERVVYCCRCLKSNHEVERLVYDPFITLCSECITNLATFLEHIRNAEKQRHTQTQPESDEGESAEDRSAISDD